MGDFTSEHIFTCDAAHAEAFQNIGEETDAAFELLGDLHEASGEPEEFRGYNYGHMNFLPIILERYGIADRLPVIDYVERPCIATRVIATQDVHAQALAVMDLLMAINADPAKLLPDILASLKRSHAFFLKAREAPDRHPAFDAKTDEAIRNTRAAVENFSMDANDLRQLFEMSVVGGYFPGDAPGALTEFCKTHEANASSLEDLAAGFGFLKTLVLPYENAADSGHAILHLQTYGT